MCTASTAKRRRKQAANDYRHLSVQRRPRYNKRSAEKSARLEAKKIANIKAIAQRKGASKK